MDSIPESKLRKRNRWIKLAVIALVLAAAITAAFWPEPTYRPKPSQKVVEAVFAAQKAMEGYTDDTTMVFADPVVETEICKMLGKDKGTVTVRDMRGIRTFTYLDVQQIETLEDFRYCENLESLEASHQRIDNLESLRGLKKLNMIDLSSNDIADLSPLAKMESLHTLFVPLNPIKSIEGLRGHKGLITIDIRWCPVTDISPLEGMGTLQSFAMGDHQLDNSFIARLFRSFQPSGSQPFRGRGSQDNPWEYDLSVLKGTDRLMHFSLIGKPKDITPLLGQKKLEQVALEGLEHKDFAALLDNCKELESISIESSSIKLSSLASLGEKVQGLFISNSDIISDASTLPCPSSLRYMTISSCNLNDVSVLAGLTKLESLSIINSGINDISPLAELKSLNTLYLQMNQIRDITPLAGLKDLKYLDLQGNIIKDIKPLRELKALKNLDLRANIVRDFTPLLDLPALKSLHIADNPYTVDDRSTADDVFEKLAKHGCNVEKK